MRAGMHWVRTLGSALVLGMVSGCDQAPGGATTGPSLVSDPSVNSACDHELSDGLSMGPDGVRIAYYQAGRPPCDAPTLVMLHGWPDNHHVFDAVVDELADRYHILRYDLRGAGGSDAPPADLGHYRFQRQVDDLRALVDHLGIDRFHLVGHDWGGAIGYEATVTPDVRERILSFTNVSGPSVDHVAQGFTPEHFDAEAPGAYLYMAHIWYIPVLMAPMLPELLADAGLTSFLVQLQYALDDGDYNRAQFSDHQWSNLANLYRENIPERSQAPTFSRVTELPLMQAVMPIDDTYVPPYYWDGKEHFHDRMWKRPVDGGHWVHTADPAGLVRAIDEAVAWTEQGIAPGDDVRVFVNGEQVAGDTTLIGNFQTPDGRRCSFGLVAFDPAGGMPLRSRYRPRACLG